jgi:hypothetical protein
MQISPLYNLSLHFCGLSLLCLLYVCLPPPLSLFVYVCMCMWGGVYVCVSQVSLPPSLFCGEELERIQITEHTSLIAPHNIHLIWILTVMFL